MPITMRDHRIRLLVVGEQEDDAGLVSGAYGDGQYQDKRKG